MFVCLRVCLCGKGNFLYWKVKRWESLSCRRSKLAPNRADHLTSTHPWNHKDLGLSLLTAQMLGAGCSLALLLPMQAIHMAKLRFKRLHNASHAFTSWEKHTHIQTLWPDPSHFRLLPAQEQLSVYTLQEESARTVAARLTNSWSQFLCQARSWGKVLNRGRDCLGTGLH